MFCDLCHLRTLVNMAVQPLIYNLRVLEYPACQKIEFEDIFKFYIYTDGSNGSPHSVVNGPYISTKHAKLGHQLHNTQACRVLSRYANAVMKSTNTLDLRGTTLGSFTAPAR